MTTGTRNVVLGGAGMLAVGIAAGVAAWLTTTTEPARVLAQERPDELRYLPSDANILGFANVRAVMDSELRRALREVRPEVDGQQEFQDRTGIDIDRDIEYVVAGLVPDESDEGGGRGLAVLVGRFDADRLEALALGHGGEVSAHRGRRLVTMGDAMALALLEPGVIALGSQALVREALDRQAGGGGVDDAHEPLLGRLRHVDPDSTAWLIGRFDDTGAGAWLPDQVEAEAAQVAGFALCGRFDHGVSGTLTIETRDEETGRHLRDLLQGFLALARLQTGSRPELAGVIDAVQVRAADDRVMLTFDLPAALVLDLLPAPPAASSDAP